MPLIILPIYEQKNLELVLLNDQFEEVRHLKSVDELNEIVEEKALVTVHKYIKTQDLVDKIFKREEKEDESYFIFYNSKQIELHPSYVPLIKKQNYSVEKIAKNLDKDHSKKENQKTIKLNEPKIKYMKKFFKWLLVFSIFFLAINILNLIESINKEITFDTSLLITSMFLTFSNGIGFFIGKKLYTKSLENTMKKLTT